MGKKRVHDMMLQLPNGENAAGHSVLLHSCCAPCSSAIIEWMLAHEMKPTVLFGNSNIFPLDEYVHRRAELERYLDALGVAFVEDDYDHSSWLQHVKGLEGEPERGRRCEACFRFRLYRAAHYAKSNGYDLFTTTLASSRWKDIEQINAAGRWAAGQMQGVTFWEQNWRKGGLQERRNELLQQYDFYNQQYCGCEFSRRASQ